MIKCPKEIKEGCDEWDQCESDDMPRDKNSFIGITGWRKKEKEGWGCNEMNCCVKRKW